MTDAEGQLLFRFNSDLVVENEALRAEVINLRAEIRKHAIMLRLFSDDLLAWADSPSIQPVA